MRRNFKAKHFKCTFDIDNGSQINPNIKSKSHTNNSVIKKIIYVINLPLAVTSHTEKKRKVSNLLRLDSINCLYNTERYGTIHSNAQPISTKDGVVLRSLSLYEAFDPFDRHAILVRGRAHFIYAPICICTINRILVHCLVCV